MSRVLRLTIAFLAIIAATAVAQPAMAAGEGIITGRVINKTAGGSPIGPIEVSLATYLNGKATGNMQKMTVDAKGTFEFKGLATDAGTSYIVGASFQSANYTSQSVTLTSANASQSVELAVYDPTTSDAAIQVSNAHMVVYGGNGALEVLEVWRFNNVGDKTFIGKLGTAGGASVKLTLPSGAMSPSAGEGIAIQFVDTEAVSSSPIVPGDTDVNFSYFLPYDGSAVSFSRKLDYPTADFHLLVQDTGVKVTSTSLTPGSKQNLSGTDFLDFAGGNLNKGVNLDAAFTGIKNVSGSTSSSFPWVWLLVGAGLLAVIVVAYPQLKRRQVIQLSTDDSPPTSGFPLAAQDEETLLAELARLDDAFEAGSLNEAKYKTRRARLKAVLIDVYARAGGR